MNYFTLSRTSFTIAVLFGKSLRSCVNKREETNEREKVRIKRHDLICACLIFYQRTKEKHTHTKKEKEKEEKTTTH